MLRSLCGVIFFKFVTSFAYFFTRFSTARPPILRFCIDKNSAFSSPETGVISFRSSIYPHRAFLTSSPKYTTTSAPPFRWILIPLFFKSTSSRSRPTHSETRIPAQHKRQKGRNHALLCGRGTFAAFSLNFRQIRPRQADWQLHPHLT